MLLAIDVGNTNVVMGVYDRRKIVANFRLTTDVKRSADEYGTLLVQMFKLEGLDPADIKDVIISCVVPSVQFAMKHMSIKYFECEPIVVETGVKTGLKIMCDDPRQVGSDRIVNSVAALTKYGGPLIVIDFGTATTFCVVTESGEFLGGAIAPGIKTAAKALFEQTAKLPNVELSDPGKMIAKNTVDCMQVGLIYGHMGLVEYIVNGMKNEMENKYGIDSSKVKVIATGGMAEMVETGVKCIDRIDKRLTLDGLLYIYEKNANLHKNRKL